MIKKTSLSSAMAKFIIAQIPILLLLFVFLLTFSSSIGTGSCAEFRPVESTQYRFMPNNTISVLGRRRLAPFQLCLLCKCCAATDPTNCNSMPCCFGIDCQLPDKPYGTCAFVPKTCNCTSCAM